MSKVFLVLIAVGFLSSAQAERVCSPIVSGNLRHKMIHDKSPRKISSCHEITEFNKIIVLSENPQFDDAATLEVYEKVNFNVDSKPLKTVKSLGHLGIYKSQAGGIASGIHFGKVKKGKVDIFLTMKNEETLFDLVFLQMNELGNFQSRQVQTKSDQYFDDLERDTFKVKVVKLDFNSILAFSDTQIVITDLSNKSFKSTVFLVNKDELSLSPN